MARLMSYTNLLFPDFDWRTADSLTLSAFLVRPTFPYRAWDRVCNRCGCELAALVPLMFCYASHSPPHVHPGREGDEMPCDCPLILVLCGDCLPKDEVTPEMLAEFRRKVADYQADPESIRERGIVVDVRGRSKPPRERGA